MVIRVLGRIKRIIVVIIVLLFVRMVFRILELDPASTAIRVIFSVIYGIIFGCAAKMILHSQSVMNKVKQKDEVISLIRFVNRIILGVFIVFFFWALAYLIRNYLVKSRYEAENRVQDERHRPKGMVSNKCSQRIARVRHILFVGSGHRYRKGPTKQEEAQRSDTIQNGIKEST